jgi:biopolymer transport protein ExbD
MNVLKNMELIFVVAASLAVVTSYATASAPVINVPAAAVAATAPATDAKMAVVVVAAKRLTAAEKAALI